jgi:hypothetical protein
LLFLFFFQDVTHIAEGNRPRLGINVLDCGLSLAGFQVIIDGRFWVITEASKQYRGISHHLPSVRFYFDGLPFIVTQVQIDSLTTAGKADMYILLAAGAAPCGYGINRIVKSVSTWRAPVCLQKSPSQHFADPRAVGCPDFPMVAYRHSDIGVIGRAGFEVLEIVNQL